MTSKSRSRASRSLGTVPDDVTVLAAATQKAGSVLALARLLGVHRNSIHAWIRGALPLHRRLQLVAYTDGMETVARLVQDDVKAWMTRSGARRRGSRIRRNLSQEIGRLRANLRTFSIGLDRDLARIEQEVAKLL